MRLIRFSLLATVCVVCGFSQSLAEHAAAGAGASIGGAAGKPVSDAITRIFGNVDKTTKKATSAPAAAPTAPPTSARPEAPELPIAPSAGVPAPAPRASAGPRALRAAVAPMSSAIVAPETPVSAPRIGQPTAEDLRAVTNGSPRSELMARLGLPSSRVTIPEDSGLLEIYRYSGADGLVGSVRLENGLVIAVQVAGSESAPQSH